MSAVLIYTTCLYEEDALSLGESLVQNKFAACINVLPKMTSIYEWGGNLQRRNEAVMIVKTTSEHSNEVVEEIKRIHPDDVPAVLVIPVVGGSEEYINWMQGQVKV